MTLDGTNLIEAGLSQNSHNWHESLTQGGTVFFVLTDTRSAWQTPETIEDREGGAVDDLGPSTQRPILPLRGTLSAAP